MAGGLGPCQAAVLVQLHLGLVGIHGDFRFLFRPVYVASAGYVYKGVFGPVGFVQIESVFFQLPVKGHQPFVVAAFYAALVREFNS